MDTPRRWNNIGEHLESLGFTIVQGATRRPRIYDIEPQTFEAIVRYAFPAEAALRDDVDTAARSIAAGTLRGLKISHDACYFLLLRIQCAKDFLGLAFPPQASDSPFAEAPGAWSDARLIEWLLVDLWRRRCDLWLKLCALDQAGPFPFYGLTPAHPNARE